MNILLINSITGFDPLTSKNNDYRIQLSLSPPIGLLYIARSFEDEGHKVTVIDYSCENNNKNELQKSLNSYDAIGIEVLTDNIEFVENIAESIKDNNNDLPIILGGPHCTFHPSKALVDIPSADISVEGEGELVVKDIIKGLKGYNNYKNLAGLYYRKNGDIKKGKPAKYIKNLDIISFPSRHLVEKYDYGKIGRQFFYKQKSTAILTSRGCPNRCRFCTRHITSNAFRMRSAENVIEELSEITDKYKSVFIADDNFLASKKRANKIFETLIKMGSPLDIYINGARVDSADVELYKKMKKAGVKHIYYGIESGNQDVLDYYNKKINIRQINTAINLANKMDFVTLGYFILGAPIEENKHIKKSIKFACKLPLDFAIFYPLAYSKGSDLWNEAIKEKKINEEEDGYGLIATSEKKLSKFTDKQLLDFCVKAYKRFYFRPLYLTRQIYKSFKRLDFTIIKYWINHNT
jgi:radical SAM superfamily enzyme YgiQ (UPF0313 family)